VRQRHPPLLDDVLITVNHTIGTGTLSLECPTRQVNSKTGPAITRDKLLPPMLESVQQYKSLTQLNMSAADADRKPPNVRCILQVEVVGSEADQARRGTDGLAVLATPHQVRQPHLLGIGAPVQHHNVFWFGHKPSKRALCQPAYRSFNTCRLCPHTLSQTLPDPLPALAQQDHAGVLQEPLYEFLHHGLRDHRTRSRLHGSIYRIPPLRNVTSTLCPRGLPHRGA